MLKLLIFLINTLSLILKSKQLILTMLKILNFHIFFILCYSIFGIYNNSSNVIYLNNNNAINPQNGTLESPFSSLFQALNFSQYSQYSSTMLLIAYGNGQYNISNFTLNTSIVSIESMNYSQYPMIFLENCIFNLNEFSISNIELSINKSFVLNTNAALFSNVIIEIYDNMSIVGIEAQSLNESIKMISSVLKYELNSDIMINIMNMADLEMINLTITSNQQSSPFFTFQNIQKINFSDSVFIEKSLSNFYLYELTLASINFETTLILQNITLDIEDSTNANQSFIMINLYQNGSLSLIIEELNIKAFNSEYFIQIIQQSQNQIYDIDFNLNISNSSLTFGSDVEEFIQIYDCENTSENGSNYKGTFRMKTLNINNLTVFFLNNQVGLALNLISFDLLYRETSVLIEQSYINNLKIPLDIVFFFYFSLSRYVIIQNLYLKQISKNFGLLSVILQNDIIPSNAFIPEIINHNYNNFSILDSDFGNSNIFYFSLNDISTLTIFSFAINDFSFYNVNVSNLEIFMVLTELPITTMQIANGFFHNNSIDYTNIIGASGIALFDIENIIISKCNFSNSSGIYGTYSLISNIYMGNISINDCMFLNSDAISTGTFNYYDMENSGYPFGEQSITFILNNISLISNKFIKSTFALVSYPNFIVSNTIVNNNYFDDSFVMVEDDISVSVGVPNFIKQVEIFKEYPLLYDFLVNDVNPYYLEYVYDSNNNLNSNIHVIVNNTANDNDFAEGGGFISDRGLSISFFIMINNSFIGIKAGSASNFIDLQNLNGIYIGYNTFINYTNGADIFSISTTTSRDIWIDSNTLVNFSTTSFIYIAASETSLIMVDTYADGSTMMSGISSSFIEILCNPCNILMQNQTIMNIIMLIQQTDSLNLLYMSSTQWTDKTIINQNQFYNITFDSNQNLYPIAVSNSIFQFFTEGCDLYIINSIFINTGQIQNLIQYDFYIWSRNILIKNCTINNMGRFDIRTMNLNVSNSTILNVPHAFSITGQSGPANYSSSTPGMMITIQDSTIINSGLLFIYPDYIVMSIDLKELIFINNQSGTLIYFPNVTISNMMMANIEIYFTPNDNQQLTFMKFDGIFGVINQSLFINISVNIDYEEVMTENSMITLFDIEFDSLITNLNELKFCNITIEGTNYTSIYSTTTTIFEIKGQSKLITSQISVNNLSNLQFANIEPGIGFISLININLNINNITNSNPNSNTGLITLLPLSIYQLNSSVNISLIESNITNIVFQDNNLQSSSGGIFNLRYLSSNLNIWIKQSNISNIKSSQGCVINYANELNNFTLCDANITFNITNSTFMNNLAYKYGGLLYIQTPNESITLDVNENDMINNTALLNGNLIFSSTISSESKDDILNNNNISNENLHQTFKSYEIAGPAYQILTSYTFNDTSFQIANNTIGLINASTVGQSNYTFNTYLADKFGQQVIDHSLNEYLNIKAIQDSFQHTISCLYGVCNFSGSLLQFSGPVGQNLSVFFIYDSENIDLSFLFYAQMRACVPGEINITNITTAYQPQYSCQPCPVNTYSFDPTDQICYSCNFTGAICNGTNLIVVSANFWRSNINSTMVYQCTYENRCLGGNYLTQCATGYTAALCSACNYNENYFSNGAAKCGTCNGLIYTLGIFALKLFFILAYDIYFIKCTRNLCVSLSESDVVTSKNLITIERSSYIRIFNTYFQIITVAYSFQFFTSDLTMLQQLNIANPINYFQESSQSLNPLATIYSSLECVYYYFGLDPKYYFYYTVTYTALLPFIKGLLINFVRLVNWRFEVTHKRKAVLYLTFVCIYIIDLPTTLNGVISFINCTNIDNVYYALNHMDVVCFGSQNSIYWILFGCVVLPSIFVWTILIPALVYYLHKKHDKDNRELYIRLTIGAFNIEYKDEYWYFGLIMNITKSLLILISNLSFIETTSRAIICGIILYGYAYLFSMKKPMRVSAINKCESYAFASFILIIISGLFCYDNPNIFLFGIGLIFSILINVWIFFYILIKMVRNLAKSVVLAVSWVKRRIFKIKDNDDGDNDADGDNDDDGDKDDDDEDNVGKGNNDGKGDNYGNGDNDILVEINKNNLHRALLKNTDDIL